MPERECKAMEQVQMLEKGLLEVTGQVGTLVGVTSKLESSYDAIASAMQIIARKEVTVEHHSESIKELKFRIGSLEKREGEIEKVVYKTCDAKSDQFDRKISTEMKSINKKIDDEVTDRLHGEINVDEKQDTKGNNRLMLLLAIIAAVFGYMYLDLGKMKAESKKDFELVLSEITKLNNSINVLDKKISNIALKQIFFSEKIKRLDHEPL